MGSTQKNVPHPYAQEQATYIWGLEAIGFFILACGFYLLAKSAIGTNQIMGLSLLLQWCVWASPICGDFSERTEIFREVRIPVEMVLQLAFFVSNMT
ncbi:hypothetical protein [Dictyobacter aurantiacus]|uniref:Uncharacterized protein n=1 Tax=Dictyobacter aurantiacus TaxID=1936993 RepID=A0A401Z9B2_9CHLR|nr:hypothetical protein [Dictyobacter aurantiacus]GCE03432.1 hypothetical protein KDAU_07610 [Dictyobacter aurantiacus]